MIDKLRDLWHALALLGDPLHPETKLRVYLNGRYIIEKVTISKNDGAIVLWLDERGDDGK